MVKIVLPASFFGIVLGLTGLGNDWRVAARIWGLPVWIGESIMLLAIGIWSILVIFYALKWHWHRAEALSEIAHPIQCCYVGLAPVSTILVGLALLPYFRHLAAAVCALGAIGTVTFAVWRQGGLWVGGRETSATTPVLYLPSVAGSFVIAIAAGTFGLHQWGQMFFGVGLFSWWAMESVILHRLLVAEPLPPALRPTLGIQLAPPAVGLVAYLSVSDNPSEPVVAALLGYALLQAAILLRVAPFIRQQSFSASYWAVTFGTSALALAAELLVEDGAGGPAMVLAPLLFITANAVIGLITLGSLALLLRGQLLPAPAAVARP